MLRRASLPRKTDRVTQFPKGRPDSLTRHLFEKCPKITEADRSRALWQPAEPQSQNSSVSHYAQPSGMNLDMLPYLPQREPSGLDTLAEVSRQLQANGVVGADEAFMAQLQLHIDESDTNSLGGGEVQAPVQAHAGASLTPSTTPPDPSVSHGAESPVPLPLVRAASATNEQLAEAAMQHSHTTAPRSRKRKVSSTAPDPTIPNSYLSYYPQRPPPAVDPQLHHPSGDSHSAAASFGSERDVAQQGDTGADDQSPAFNMNSGGFGLLQRANKSKARGRFTEERRREVQTVRKKGACLRCRMLKKPCSEGTPCGTCKNIESARLWKQSCIRTRVADEFGLYATTYFYSKDRKNVYASLNGCDPLPVAGRIEVTLFPDAQLYATFPALKTNHSGRSTGEHEPEMLDAYQDNDANTADIFLLSFKTEDTLALKLERYIYASIVQCISSESSTVMRSTLEVAAELSVEHDDGLLTKFIHLWAATNLLVTEQPLWTISYNSVDSPVVDHITVVDEKTDEGRASVKCSSEKKLHFDLDSPDYKIMHAQLQDAAERYCQKQAKTCLNELERRLLQRQQSSSFLTFLAAIILLNCVERMTALYYAFDPLADSASTDDVASKAPRNSPPDEAMLDENSQSRDHPDRNPDWPLTESPSKFWPQGHTFSSLLQLLLRMRGLPPSIHIRDDGSLAVLSNLNKAYPVEVSSTSDGSDGQQTVAAQWIQRTGLRARDLWNAYKLSDQEANREAWDDERGEPTLDGATLCKGVRAWDLRFIAPLLLPAQQD